MKPCLDTFSTPGRELQADVIHGAEAGFEALWVRAAKLDALRAVEGAKAPAALLKRRGMRVAVVDGVEGCTFRGVGGGKSRRAEIASLCAQAAELGAQAVVARPGRRPSGLRYRELREETRGALGDELLPVCGRYGLTLLFEPWGHPESSVRTVRLALELCEGLPVKLAADAFESHRGGEGAEVLGEATRREASAPKPGGDGEDPALAAAIAAALLDPTASADPTMLAAALAARPSAGGGLIVAPSMVMPLAAPAPKKAEEQESAAPPALPVWALAACDAPATDWPERLGDGERRLPGAGVLPLQDWVERAGEHAEVAWLVARTPMPRAARANEVLAVYRRLRASLAPLLEAAGADDEAQGE